MVETVTEKLKAVTGMMLTYENKWMVWDRGSKRWMVFGKKRYQRATRTLFDGAVLPNAVEILLRKW